MAEKITRHSDNSTLAVYNYLLDGSKLSTTGADGTGYEYLGSLVYKRSSDSLCFESTPFSGGRIAASPTQNGSSFSTYYYLTDHLGSVRAIMDTQGNVLERNDYYAFGQRINSSNAPAAGNRYLFNGKEKLTTGGVDYLDYGARMYDTQIGRWISPDPMAEMYYPTSPYAYVRNNPISRIDPNGMWDEDYDVAEDTGLGLLDDYRLNYKNGAVSLSKRTSDAADRLIGTDRKGREVVLNDIPKGILSELSTNRSDYNGRYAITDSYKAGDLFLFAANNSDVEWKLQGYQGTAGRQYVISTSHNHDKVSVRDNSNDGLTMANQYFNIHSHPDIDGTKGASGLFTTGYQGDMANIVNSYYHCLSEGINLPTHYVYHKYSNTLYQYTPWDNDIYIKTIHNNEGLRFIVPKR